MDFKKDVWKKHFHHPHILVPEMCASGLMYHQKKGTMAAMEWCRRQNWGGDYGHTARNKQMDMDDVWLKGLIIQSNTGSISQIAPGNDVMLLFFYFFNQKACELSYIRWCKQSPETHQSNQSSNHCW